MGTATAVETGEYASLIPDDFIAGGLLNNAYVEFRDVKFVLWNYNKADQEFAPFLFANLYPLDDTMSVPSEQKANANYWRAGDMSNWVPSADGSRLKKVGSQEGIVETTNFGTLMASVVPKSGKEHFTDGTCKALNGMKAYITRKTVERPGLEKRNTKYPDEVYIVEKLVSIGGQVFANTTNGAGAATGKAAGTATGAGKPPAAAKGAAPANVSGVVDPQTGDPEADLTNVVQQILRGKPDKTESIMVLRGAAGKVFQNRPPADKAIMAKLIKSDEWWTQLDFAASISVTGEKSDHVIFVEGL